ncbi:MAG: hypothetical protein JWM49_459 [Microbacteriaceae bacterium]|nr:hypothetical protein [Microbacteriaceae bacterium]
MPGWLFCSHPGIVMFELASRRLPSDLGYSPGQWLVATPSAGATCLRTKKAAGMAKSEMTAP